MSSTRPVLAELCHHGDRGYQWIAYPEGLDSDRWRHWRTGREGYGLFYFVNGDWVQVKGTGWFIGMNVRTARQRILGHFRCYSWVDSETPIPIRLYGMPTVDEG